MRPLPVRSLMVGAGLLLAGCRDIGYVEVRTVPAATRLPALYLDQERIEPPREGVAVLRQNVGTRRLQIESGGQFMPLCEVVVRKDRITTVTISALERPPRCQCARPSGPDAQSRRVCIS
jgi:hypothetical protein